MRAISQEMIKIAFNKMGLSLTFIKLRLNRLGSNELTMNGVTYQGQTVAAGIILNKINIGDLL